MVATAKKRPSQGVLYSRAFTPLRLKKTDAISLNSTITRLVLDSCQS